MTLLDTIRAIESAAARQPAVNTIVRSDVFKLNAVPDIRYGAFAWTQRQHRGAVENDWRHLSFALFYVDRLTSDQSNREEVQSVAVEVLTNIIAAMEEAGVEAESEYTVDTFNQRFADECAGAFAVVTFAVPATTLCPVDYFGPLGDFNEDFNADFLLRAEPSARTI